MADPTDAVAVAEVEHMTGCQVTPVLMTLSAVEELVETMFRALVTEVIKRVGEPAAAEESPRAARVARRSGVEAAMAVAPAARAMESGAAAAGEVARPIDGPVTVPFHRLSDEADLETRLRALVNVLLARRVIGDDDLEEEVRRLMRGREDEDS